MHTPVSDKIPIILRDMDERKKHYIFANRPGQNESYNVVLSFTTTAGKTMKYRIPIDNNTVAHDISVKGNFIIENDTSPYKDPKKLGEVLMKESLQELVEDKGRFRRTKNFQPRKSRLSHGMVGGGKFILRTRSIRT